MGLGFEVVVWSGGSGVLVAFSAGMVVLMCQMGAVMTAVVVDWLVVSVIVDPEEVCECSVGFDTVGWMHSVKVVVPSGGDWSV